jgi:carboxyl-terminal processing protease
MIAGLASGEVSAAQQKPDSTPRATRPHTPYEDMQMFSQVLNQIRVNHPDSIETHELMKAAVEGMVHAADPHSFVVWFTPLSAEKYKASKDGKLIRVPLLFAFIDETPVVVGIQAGSDAAEQDILIGDALVAADGAPVNAESEEELEIELAGPKKSVVRLTFERRHVDGSLVTLQRDVKRERSEKEDTSVPVAFMLDGKTGYVRITTFMGEKIADDLHRAVGRLEDRGMERLILDLRDNGGGSVDEAAKVAGEFLPSGTIVYTSEGRKAEMADTGRVKRSFWKSERRFPVVLMINEGTASASELVAGALQDHDRALIVGEPSFGKALIMVGLPLGNMPNILGYIELVVGHGRTPCGRVIQRQYHAMARREYYRMARTERDTAGRPWCKTDAGRVVYGGGGIYPDLLIRHDEKPLWYQRVREDNLALKWLGGYVTAAGASFPSLDSLAANPHLPPAAIEQFRGFVAQDSLRVPLGPEADTLLNQLLVRGAARLKWGDAGYYRLMAIFDRDVALASTKFDQARAILNPAH